MKKQGEKTEGIIRVIPCRAVTGEGAGIAVSICDDTTKLDISRLQSKLEHRGVILHYRWWNMCDKTAYEGENQFHAGLLRNDCSKKPVYSELSHLVNEVWRTKAEETVSGELRFSGYYGDYEIEAEHDGK